MLKNTLPHYKIVFLLLVHEAIDCVEDFIQNVKATCPNSAVLFHVNSSCSDNFWEQSQQLEKFYDFVYLLPDRMASHWDSGLQLEIYFDMFDYAIENLNFDYVYLTASNSLIVNSDLENFVTSSNIDIFYYNPNVWVSGWVEEAIKKDKAIWDYTSQYDNKIYVNICEGMCMNKKMINALQDELGPFLDYKHVGYPKVEYLLPTAFVNLPKNFSHVDKNLEKWVWLTDHNMNEYNIQVDCVREYVFDLILNSKFDVLSKMYVFSLKRIDRVYTDVYRTLIREHFGYNNILF